MPRDGTQVEGLTAQPASGYCCPEGSTDDKCNKSTYKCTGTNNGLGENPMPLTLWSTFWPGISSKCGGSLTGTANDVTVSQDEAVIEARTPDSTYTEACLWTITPEENSWGPDADIWITLVASTDANIYVYSGDSVYNATNAIQFDGAIDYGAPTRVKANGGALVVMQTTGGKVKTGGGKFTYSVEGHPYNWIERPFIGKWVGLYYITIIVIFIAGYCFLGPLVFGILYGVFWMFCPLLAPIPPILIIYGCCSICGFTGGKGRRRRGGRTRNQRFGRQ